MTPIYVIIGISLLVTIVAFSHARGFMTGYNEGRNSAERTATHRFKHDGLPLFWRN